MSFTEAPEPVPTAIDILAFDQNQLVQYLDRNRDSQNGFDFSSATGVEHLSKSQRDTLGSKIREAAEIAAASRPVDGDALFTLLKKIESERDASPEFRPLQSPGGSSVSSQGTLPPHPNKYIVEESRYHELIRDGGRPVCPLESWLHIQEEPEASLDPIRPWLSRGYPKWQIQTVFSRQFSRWCEFRKWQWNTRGATDGGFSAYIAANQRMDVTAGWRADGDELDDDDIYLFRRLWEQLPVLRQFPEGQTFPAYVKEMNRRLAPHNFSQTSRFMKDPLKQTRWNTWLEYLNFEQCDLERDVDLAEAREQQYHEAWEKMCSVIEPFLEGEMGSRSINKNLPFPGVDYPAVEAKTKLAPLSQQLAAAQADLATTHKTLKEFFQDTAPYRSAQEDLRYGREIVHWAVKEARIIEAEMLQQRSLARKRPDARESKKRKSSDDNHIVTPEPWSKRTRQRLKQRGAPKSTRRGGGAKT